MERLPSIENIEAQIERLLVKLHEFAATLPQETVARLEDEWYEVEMGAEVGADRSQALAGLNRFIDKLSEMSRLES